MKVFYSWQSDTPGKVGRTFLREALETAIAGLDLEDSDRPEIDQGTKGVLGSPPIADTIFKKIREAKVVVADVTLTGSTPSGKRLCNSNVAIELGYALGVHGDEVLLKVMNTHYGRPEDLPFDLAHRRWPLQFELSPDVDNTQRQKVCNALAKELSQILQQYVAASQPKPGLFIPTPHTHNPAAYWQGDDLLVKQAIQYRTDQPLLYLRIWPLEKIEPLSAAVLTDYNKSVIEPFCGSGNGWSYERNKYGLISFSTFGNDSNLASSTQVLKTGEIWGVNEYFLRPRENFPKFVPTGAFERGVRESLRKYLLAARRHFGYPPTVMIESGFVNASGFHLAMNPEHFDQFWGPLFEDVKVTAEIDTDASETITAALLTIYNGLFEAAGRPRPENLNSFP
jgi:hypothetical protein